MTETTVEKILFVDDNGQTQPILRLNKAEMNSPDWKTEVQERLKHWKFPPSWHRMGTSNELHAPPAENCPYCRKRMGTSNKETVVKGKTTEKTDLSKDTSITKKRGRPKKVKD